ncbi:MAG: response regulator, partial [Lachnospiraceae bacterium]|nr:response regulator [Lachnospiraceae bacterium]
MSMNEILIVDDEGPIRMALKMAFKRENMETAEASDGIQALEMLRHDRYQLIILDVMMPGKGGYEVLQEMRRRGDNTPVLMLSGKDDEMNQVLG